MAKALYISATNQKSGKSAVTIGLMRLLIGRMGKVAFFRPIIQDVHAEDVEVALMNEFFGLELEPSETYACTAEEARRYINDGETSTLMNRILKAYDNLIEKYDFVLCQGTDFYGQNSAFELELNSDIAGTLGVPVMLVHPALESSGEEAQVGASTAVDVFHNKGLEVVSLVINRANFTEKEKEETLTALAKIFELKFEKPPLVHVIPNNIVLGRPSMRDVALKLNAKVLYGKNHLMTNHIDDFLVAAMHVGNFLNFIQEDHLIITPGDRDDILLGSVVSKMSKETPSISGVLITGGIEPSDSIKHLLNGMPNLSLPIMSVETNTSETVYALQTIRDRIYPDDTHKVHTALSTFDRHVDIEELATRIVDKSFARMTPRMFDYTLMERAKKHPMRIVLPEGAEERILRAADAIRSRGTAKVILIGNIQIIEEKAAMLAISLENITIINPQEFPRLDEYAEEYAELRKKKGVTLEQARDRMLDPTYFGTMMVHKNDADGLVSGSINTTANTVRPALEFIKTKPGFSIVSSAFLMCLKDRVLAFGDCAINPDPTAEQLADIAITTAETGRIFGIEPRIAMLSYSTGTSGKGEDVDKVIEATRIAKERAPELLLEGPLQYDAAINPDVAKTKMPNSPVAGQASVFIFPDLNTGNNTYKAVQRAADAIAIGPILQGLKRPVNDLSRGCTVADIINTVAITAIQAQAEKGLE